MINLKEGERIDDLNRNGYQIIQHKDKFCFGMDAVLLTGFAEARKGEVCVDLGTGTGIIPILMEAKYPQAAHFTGLEIQPESAEMAARSVELNKLTEKVSIVNGDIKEAAEIFGKAVFDVVTSNPPYMTESHGLTNPNEAKAVARHEIKCTLSDVCEAAKNLLKPGGRFYMVHRPFRLDDIILELRSRNLMPKRIQMVHSDVNKEATMVLTEAVRGGKARVKVMKPLIIYDENGEYTRDVLRIYEE